MVYIIGDVVLHTLLMQGGRILEMIDPVMHKRCLDIHSFISMLLPKFPQTFNVSNMSKGTFPHLFNTSKNYYYRGTHPDVKYYNTDNMQEPGRSHFIQ